MMSQFAPQQVPRKYGGVAANPNNYWPPVMPPGPFGAPGENQENRLSQKSSYSDFFPDHNVDTEIQEQESIERGALSVFSDRSLSILEILRAGDRKDDDVNQLDVCFVAGEEDGEGPTRLPLGDVPLRDSLSSLGTLGTERLRLKDALSPPLDEAQRQTISHRRLLATREPALETLLEGHEIVGCSWNCRTCAAQDPTDSFCCII